MGLFDNLKDADISSGSKYLLEGDYVLKALSASELKTNKDGKKKVFYVVKFQVIESNNDKIPVGDERSWFCDMGQESSDSNVNGFLVALLGYNYTNPQHKAEVDAKIKPQLPAFGEATLKKEGGLFEKKNMIKCTVVNTKTRAGGNFSRHNFYPHTA